ncbi:cat eye syndrome critical region 5 [Brachionus plicatilis]|uniref:Cat eye syndrome critical region 5 n=1 Tax=Brachionus plicatilis TaxID=10195 RepID=A0A3M7S887_BRAPC|nr:cat eye syndrome critical region 5 [Brachionus plicatilis]
MSENQDTNEVNPGVFIDIDGVVLKGGRPFEWSKKAIHALWYNNIPFVFVTNGTYCSKTLIDTLESILELPFTNDHCVVAPSPCKALTDYHNKRVLVCCQNDSYDLISELGFKDYLTVPELVNIFPDLDFVDHERRHMLLKNPLTDEQKKLQAEFRPIEVILLLGEPINWECALQILLDVIMTNGDPRKQFKFVPFPHLPIIACNKDLTFKGAAALPRFGHGAFLECLETLYMKVTRNELVYEYLMGKPYLITYEYAAEQIQNLSKNGQRINKFYIIGDNPEVDVRGANLYKESLTGEKSNRGSTRTSRRQSTVDFLNQNLFKPVESILVCTGVYNPQSDMLYHLRNLFDKSIRRSSINPDCLPNEFEGITLTVPQQITQKESSSNFLDVEALQLKEALSRKNSFISYFDNQCNIPDVTVDNLMDAVNYIIESSK